MTNKIGWQKYEEVIEEQLTSPMASLLASNMLEPQEENDHMDHLGFIERDDKELLLIPIPNEFYEQVLLLSNYDCWIGHTNFDITHAVKEKINKTEGVELLRIYSRYRFLVGIGKMFEFPGVRRRIEKSLL